jgi:hypothetical protein
MAIGQIQADVCGGCREVRPLSEFYEEGADWGPGQSGPRCRACRQNRSDLPAFVESARSVPAKFRTAIDAHLAAPPGTPWSVARAESGLSPYWTLENILNKSPEARRLYQNLLTEMGMDFPYMAAKLRLNLHALKPMWNNEEKAFEFFPDYSTQQKALDLLHRMHGLLNPPDAEGMRPAQLVIVTNVGNGQPPKRVDARTFTLDASTGTVTEGSDE